LLVLSAGDEKNTGRYRLSQYFISEYEKHGAVSAINSVIYWYKKPFKIEINKTSETTQILEEHKRCINYYKIEHSPVVYYNKFRLPIGYTLKDMIFIANI